MYELIKQVISTRTYNDSNALISKMQRLYIEGTLSEEQYIELRELMAEVEPVKQYNAEEEIDRIWTKLREIESRLDNIGTVEQPSEEEETIDDFKQPTGAHDAYPKGSKVRFNGVIYESIYDGLNSWSPEVYPQGWRVVEEGEDE